jgi:hypothetical protein
MHIARLARRAGGAVVLGGCLALGGLMTPSAFADPPGNNGTIKIDAEEFDSHPDNQPHVGCVFQVDFYGYDEGDLFADLTFRAHPPTGDGEVLETDRLFIGEDDNSGGGSQAGLDASGTYTLDFTGFEPHPQQGFHVKLTINAEGSQGADVKHKVFWVEECPPSPPPTTETPKPEESETPTPKPEDEESETPTPKPEDEESETPTPKPEESETPAPVPTEVPAGADTAGGGGSAADLLGLAVVTGGAVAGTAVIARRRFLHDS